MRFPGHTKPHRPIHKKYESVRTKNLKPEQESDHPQFRLAPNSRALRLLTLSLWPFCTVLGAALFSIGHPGGIQRSTNDVISNARQILYTAATDQDDGVFLQIVADTRDISCNFNPIGQTHTCNFAKGRIRLLWCRRIYSGAYASFLRTLLQRRTTRLVIGLLSTLSNQLIKRRHELELLNLEPHPAGNIP
jgi:hypothetical protein